jgi:hypothetical protein
MDRSPRALARWLPALALALIVESVVSVVFAFTVRQSEGSWHWLDIGFWSMIRTFVHLPHVALLIGFGVAVRSRTAAGDYRIAAQRLLWGGMFAIGITALTRFQDVYVWSTASWAALLLQAAGSVLLGCAAPGLWGTAIAREADLGSPRIAAAGRAFAISALAGFGVYLVSEGIRLAVEGIPGPSAKPLAAFATFTLLLFVARFSLLWSTLLFWREPADEIAARTQSRKVQALMLGWMAASSAALVFSAIVGVFEGQIGGVASSLMLLWHALVQTTLTLILTILAALSLERPALDFEPRRKRSLLTEPMPPPAADHSPIDLP